MKIGNAEKPFKSKQKFRLLQKSYLSKNKNKCLPGRIADKSCIL